MFRMVSFIFFEKYAYIDTGNFRLKDQLIVGGESDTVSFKEIFNSYRGLFEAEKPLGMKEFYTVLKIAFPQPPNVEEAFTNNASPIDTTLQNVKYSPTRRIDGKGTELTSNDDSLIIL